MSEEILKAEVALAKLAQRVKQGLAKRHPMTEENLKAVREGVQKQWEQEQVAKKELAEIKESVNKAKSQGHSQTQSKEKKKDQEQSNQRSKDKGQSHTQ